MRLDDYRMAVQAGEGLVGRFPAGALLLVGDDEAAGPHQLIDLFRTVPDVGSDLGPQLEEVFARIEPDAVSAFAAVVQTSRGMAVYLHGPVEVAAEGTNVTFRAWGPSDNPLQRYDAPDSVGAFTMRYLEAEVSNRADTRTLDLRAGVVPGNALTFRRSDFTGPTAAMTGGSAGAMTGGVDAVANGAQSAAHHGTAGGDAGDMAAVGIGAGRPAGVGTAPVRAAPSAGPGVSGSHFHPPHETVTQPSAAPGRGFAPASPSSGAFPTRNTGGPPTGTTAPAFLATRADEHAGGYRDGLLRPTYPARVAARLLVTLTALLAWALLAGLVLPVGFAPRVETYTMVGIGFGLLLGLGVLVSDPIAQLIQNRRRDRGWPALLLPVQAVVEGLVAYGLFRLLLDAFVVSQQALVIYLAVTVALLAVGLYLVVRLPFLRRWLTRGDRAPSADGTTGADRPLALVAGDQPATAQPAADSAQLVWGINCARGHFNRPDARYCAACGTAMHGLTREPVQAPRPTLGYLLLDDGSAHLLDTDLVVGRFPQSDENVHAGRGRALAVPDAGPGVAEAHADVHLDQWDVTVTDRGFGDGTYLKEPDNPNWIRLTPGHRFTVASGTTLRFGERTAVYHALNRR